MTSEATDNSQITSDRIPLSDSGSMDKEFATFLLQRLKELQKDDNRAFQTLVKLFMQPERFPGAPDKSDEALRKLAERGFIDVRIRDAYRQVLNVTLTTEAVTNSYLPVAPRGTLKELPIPPSDDYVI